MIVFDERRDEFFGDPVMCQCVDVEGKSNILLGCIEDLFAASDASVVDYYRWVADVFTNLRGDGREGLRRGDVASVVVDAVRYCSISATDLENALVKERTYEHQNS